MIEIVFEFESQNTTIQGNASQPFKEIISGFCHKVFADSNEIEFYVNGQVIDPEKTVGNYLIKANEGTLKVVSSKKHKEENNDAIDIAEVKLGYSGCVLKTLNKDAYIGIHKTVAKLMKNNEICIAFDVKNCEFTFVGFDELSGRPNFLDFKQTALGKKMMQKDADTPIKSNYLFLKPFKILICSKADQFFKTQNIFFAHGKINKTKNFKSDVLESENNEDLKDLTSTKGVKNISSLREVLGKRTIWCLCPREMEKRTLAATNLDGIKDLTPEEQEKCKLYVSIMKSELAKLDDIPYFKESCELSSQ